MAALPMIFTDGLLEASVQHGVARLVLGQIQVDGKPAASGQLCIPLAQLPGLAQALGAVVKQVEAKLREAQGPKPQAERVEAEALPGAFTFGER